MKKIIIVLLFFFMFGCTENQRAKKFGGTATETLSPGQKLVVATWKDNNLWLLTRPMRNGENVEKYILKEYSSFGVLQGKVIIEETK